ncbi:MAG: energy transducer TonB [Betaproteobacteria bacterium]|nr:energy transducer TonB [Betaproteobacteria bacterium]
MLQTTIHSMCRTTAWPAAAVGAAILLLLAACQKSDPVPTTADRLKSVAQRQDTQPDFFAPRKSVDYMASLKNFKDAPAPAPAPAAPAPAPVKTEPAKAPAPEVRPAPVAPPVAAPTPAPAPVVVASAAPTARPAAPAVDPQAVTVIKREQPDFPRDAIRAGVEAGTVRAKITMNAGGDVTNVTIVASNPPRVFDRAVRSSLERWKFNPGADGRTYETEIGFKVAN